MVHPTCKRRVVSDPMPASEPLFGLNNSKHIQKAKSSITVSVRAKANRLAAQHEGEVLIPENGLDVI